MSDREWQFLNRTYIAQITGINEADGTASVVFLDGLCATRDGLELPWLGFSMNGQKSSWLRYMPQVADKSTTASGGEVGGGGDLVYVVFGPHNEARIVGYCTQPGMYAGFVGQKTSAPKTVPRGDFVDLRQGEWDLRSSGGAYILGQNSGALTLSAGPTVRVLLDKQNNESRAEGGLWKVASNGSFTRLGDIKRKLLLTDFKETDVSSPAVLVLASLDPLKAAEAGVLSPFVALDPASKEWWLHFETPPALPLGPSTLIVDEQLGACRDSIGLPYFSSVAPVPSTIPLRYRRKIWDVGTLSVAPLQTAAYSNEIDALGNQSVVFGLGSTKVEVDGGPLTAASASFLSVDVTATTSISLTGEAEASLSSLGTTSVSSTTLTSISSDALVKVDASIVSLGDPVASVVNPAVHGTALLTQLGLIVGPIEVLATTLATLEGGPETPKGAAWTAVATAMGVALALLAQPPGEPVSLLSAKVFVE